MTVSLLHVKTDGDVSIEMNNTLYSAFGVRYSSSLPDWYRMSGVVATTKEVCYLVPV